MSFPLQPRGPPMKSTIARTLLLVPMTLAAHDGPDRAVAAWSAPKPAKARAARPAPQAKPVRFIPVNRRTVTMRKPFSVYRIYNAIKSAVQRRQDRRPAPALPVPRPGLLGAASAYRMADSGLPQGSLMLGFVPVREGDDSPRPAAGPVFESKARTPKPVVLQERSMTRVEGNTPPPSIPPSPVSVARDNPSCDPDAIVLDGAASAGEPEWPRPANPVEAPAPSMPRADFHPATSAYLLDNPRDVDVQLALNLKDGKADFIYVDDPAAADTIQVLNRRGRTTWVVKARTQVRVYLGAPKAGRELWIQDEDGTELEVLTTDFGAPS